MQVNIYLFFFLEVWEHKTGAGRVRKCHAYPDLKDRAGGGSMRVKHMAKNCHGVKGGGWRGSPKHGQKPETRHCMERY